MSRKESMWRRESNFRKSDLDIADSTTTLDSDIVKASEPKNKTDAKPGSSRIPTHMSIEKFAKHQILTEKAKMNIKPHALDACLDHKIMVREEKDFKYMPEWDSSKHCFMRDMIESKRDNVHAKDLLEKQRQERELTRIESEKQIEKLKNEQLAFGASFIHFNTFVNDHLDKKERAIENLKAEQATQADINEQITVAELKLEKLTEIKNGMEKSIADRQVYVDYLEVRAKAPHQYGNGVHEIAQRFELLLQVRQNLADQHTESVIKMQELANKMFRITDERTQQMVNLNRQITELYCRYNDAKQEAIYSDSVVNKVEDMTARQSRLLTRVRNSCWNLYIKICENHDISVKLERHQIKEQLAVIEKTILHLRRAVNVVRKKKEKCSDGSLGRVTSNKKP